MGVYVERARVLGLRPEPNFFLRLLPDPITGEPIQSGTNRFPDQDWLFGKLPFCVVKTASAAWYTTCTDPALYS